MRYNPARNPLASSTETPGTARAALISTATGGGITLVVGAGISIGRKIPSWRGLTRAVISETFGSRSSLAREIDQASDLPQLLPILLELAHLKLGDEQFVKVLRKNLYKHTKFPRGDAKFANSNESLAVLARTIVQEHKSGAACRINAVVSFNADDVLEQAIYRVASARAFPERIKIVRPIARSTHAWIGTRRHAFIPVYHVHGFLPSGRLNVYSGNYEYMLVFTDSQYWSTSAYAYSFANRVVTSALSEGTCMFVGLSMTDLNLLRWFAIRSVELDRDNKESLAGSVVDGKGRMRNSTLERQFARHFWVRSREDSHGEFLSEFLWYRGIRTVTIDTWRGDSFAKLMAHCFPPASA